MPVEEEKFKELQDQVISLQEKFQQHTHNGLNSFQVDPSNFKGFPVIQQTDAWDPTQLYKLRLPNGSIVYTWDDNGGIFNSVQWTNLVGIWIPSKVNPAAQWYSTYHTFSPGTTTITIPVGGYLPFTPITLFAYTSCTNSSTGAMSTANGFVNKYDYAHSSIINIDGTGKVTSVTNSNNNIGDTSNCYFYVSGWTTYNIGITATVPANWTFNTALLITS